MIVNANVPIVVKNNDVDQKDSLYPTAYSKYIHTIKQIRNTNTQHKVAFLISLNLFR